MTTAPKTKRQWIKHRPKIQLRLLGERRPGSTFTAEIRLRAKRAVPVDGVTAELRGHQQLRLRSGNAASTHQVAFLRLEAQVLPKGSLTAGEHVYTVSFQLPSDAPPSITATGLRVIYTLRIHVHIPWWPDRKAEYDIPVEFPLGELQQRPAVFVSNEGGPEGRRPYAELSLASTQLATGTALRGAVALYNVEHVRYHVLALELRRRHQVSHGRRRADDYQHIGYTLKLPATLLEGDAMPFHLQLPKTMAASYVAAQLLKDRWAIDWSLLVRVEVPWSRDLRFEIPLSVVELGRHAPRIPLQAAPSIGSERLASLWSAVARAHDLEHEEGELRGHEEAGTMILQRHRDGEGQLSVVATIQLAKPLGLGLEVHPAGLLRGLGGVEVGERSFDRHHLLRGHDSAQLAYLLTPLLRGWPERSRLHGNDEGLRLVVPGGGYHRRSLEALVTRARRWLAELPERRAEVPLPAEIEPHRAFWERLAELQGETTFDPGAVELSTRELGRGLRLGIDWSSPQRHRGLFIALTGRPLESYQLLVEADDRNLGSLPRGARERVERLLREAPAPTLLAIDDRGVRLAHLLDYGEKPEAILARCRALAELLPHLEGRSGPYR